MARQILIETFYPGPSQLALTESPKTREGGPRIWRLEGKFGHVDRPTDNGNIYPRVIVQKNIDRLKEAANGGALFGHVDHPGKSEDPGTKLANTGLLIWDLHIKEDGDIWGVADVPLTTRGKDLAAILDIGGRPGVSSRGNGSVKPVVWEGRRCNEVQEDFLLEAYDAVATPAAEGARPSAALTEEMEMAGKLIESLADLRQSLPKLVAELEAEVREQSKAEAEARVKVALGEALAKAKEEALKEAKEEALRDPKVGGARTLVESLVDLLRPYGLEGESKTILEAKDREIEVLRIKLSDETQARIEAEGQAEEAVTRLEEASKVVYLYRVTDGQEFAEEIRESLWREVKDLSEKAIEERAQDIARTKLAEVARDREVQSRVEALERDNVKLSQALGRAVEIFRESKISKEREEILDRHPRGDEIDGLIEAMERGGRELNEHLKQSSRRGSRLYEDVRRGTGRRSGRAQDLGEERLQGRQKRQDLRERRDQREVDAEGEYEILPGITQDDILYGLSDEA
ncbi:hypothetical protein KKG24_05245 [Patescibacteria group bacterium]|nr:hypothetical protein [Patescibacteria group bacterium]